MSRRTRSTPTATRRTNALRAGLPANFIVANPDLLGGANMTTNGGGTRYNAMVLILKRRMSSGLQFDTSYTYGKGTEGTGSRSVSRGRIVATAARKARSSTR